jgi:hypothetical protein
MILIIHIMSKGTHTYVCTHIHISETRIIVNPELILSFDHCQSNHRVHVHRLLHVALQQERRSMKKI